MGMPALLGANLPEKPCQGHFCHSAAGWGAKGNILGWDQCYQLGMSLSAPGLGEGSPSKCRMTADEGQSAESVRLLFWLVNPG